MLLLAGESLIIFALGGMDESWTFFSRGGVPLCKRFHLLLLDKLLSILFFLLASFLLLQDELLLLKDFLEVEWWHENFLHRRGQLWVTDTMDRALEDRDLDWGGF